MSRIVKRTYVVRAIYSGPFKRTLRQPVTVTILARRSRTLH